MGAGIAIIVFIIIFSIVQFFFSVFQILPFRCHKCGERMGQVTVYYDSAPGPTFQETVLGLLYIATMYATRWLIRS